MPARRRRSTSQGRRISGRRRPAWAEFQSNVVVASTAFSNINLLADLDVAGSSILGVTVVRTLVRIQVQNWATVLTDSISVGLMAGRLSDVGAAAPATALAFNPGLSWAWHDLLLPRSDGATIRAIDIYEIDSRAMRRIRNVNETFLLCLANASTGSKTMEIFVRTLVALP